MSSRSILMRGLTMLRSRPKRDLNLEDPEVRTGRLDLNPATFRPQPNAKGDLRRADQ